MGIDPGLADVGYGVVERDGKGGEARHVAHGVIQTKAGVPMALRLRKIYEELQAVIDEHEPDAVAVEELFFASNVKTAMVVAQARGVAILASANANVPLAEYSPPKIKQSVVGYGRADKRQVQKMVQSMLKLAEMPKPDHAADALAVALCHLHHSSPLLAATAQIEAAEAAQADEADAPNKNKQLLAMQRGKRTARSRR